jgi:hypothetical protein
MNTSYEIKINNPIYSTDFFFVKILKDESIKVFLNVTSLFKKKQGVTPSYFRNKK